MVCIELGLRVERGILGSPFRVLEAGGMEGQNITWSNGSSSAVAKKRPSMSSIDSRCPC